METVLVMVVSKQVLETSKATAVSGLTEHHRGPKEQAFQGPKSLSGSQPRSLCHGRGRGGGLGKDLHGAHHPETPRNVPPDSS